MWKDVGERNMDPSVQLRDGMPRCVNYCFQATKACDEEQDDQSWTRRLSRHWDRHKQEARSFQKLLQPLRTGTQIVTLETGRKKDLKMILKVESTEIGNWLN